MGPDRAQLDRPALTSGSTNPIVDEHITGIFGLIVLATLATRRPAYAGEGEEKMGIGCTYLARVGGIR